MPSRDATRDSSAVLSIIDEDAKSTDSRGGGLLFIALLASWKCLSSSALSKQREVEVVDH